MNKVALFLFIYPLFFVCFRLKVQPRVQPETPINSTVNIVFSNWKTLSNGEHPLMIRVCKDGKKKYQSLGVSVNPVYWDFKKNRPKANSLVKSELTRLSQIGKYETWLRKKGITENTIGIRLRILRTIYNLAIEDNIAKTEHYPLKSYKVSKLHQETTKRAIFKEEINRIIGYNSKNKFMNFPIDLFAFTYYIGGINFVDIAYLTRDNIVDSRLVYTRRKTGKLTKPPLQLQAIELIEITFQF